MKKLLLLLLFMPAIGWSSNAIVYDLTTFRVTNYLQSVHTPNYEGNPDVIINPDLSAVLGVPMRYWKVVGGTDVELMTAGEQSDVDLDIEEKKALNIRASASGSFTSQFGTAILMRAVVEIIMDEINILRAEHGLSPRTLSQLKTAIHNKIDSGDVDN